MDGFSPASPPRIFWNSRKRSASGRSLEGALREEDMKASSNNTDEDVPAMADGVPPSADGVPPSASAVDDEPMEEAKSVLSEKRKALFEPLEPIGDVLNGRRTPAEVLLPPPDFDTMTYPKGWLVGKKRKLVNVDVVESMRRIAVQEMNRKDREIDGLNEQLEEDARCLEHLQVQLLQERSKRAEVERENSVLQDQISMLMNMLDETEAAGDDVAPGDS